MKSAIMKTQSSSKIMIISQHFEVFYKLLVNLYILHLMLSTMGFSVQSNKKENKELF